MTTRLLPSKDCQDWFDLTRVSLYVYSISCQSLGNDPLILTFCLISLTDIYPFWGKVEIPTMFSKWINYLNNTRELVLSSSVLNCRPRNFFSHCHIIAEDFTLLQWFQKYILRNTSPHIPSSFIKPHSFYIY